MSNIIFNKQTRKAVFGNQNYNQKRNRKFLCTENIYEYCAKTSLHGLRFVGDREITKCERLYFAVVFIIALAMSLQFTHTVYKKWSSTPIITGLSTSATYINKIPFPSITICNMNQARASKVKDLNKSTLEYSILQTLCSRESEYEAKDVHVTHKMDVYKKFIMDTAQPCDEMLLSCRFGSVQENCSEVFRAINTDEGLCCVFNTVAPQFMYKKYKHIRFADYIPKKNYTPVPWTPENNYPPNLPDNHTPRSAQGTGTNLGLTVVLNVQADEYYCSSTNGVGFKVLLHNSVEEPNVGSLGVPIKIGYETRITIQPTINVASEALKFIKKKYRLCIFENESNLTYFATYTRRNCELECEAQVLIEQCNCIMYYMPNITPNVNVCSFKDIECFNKARVNAHKLNDNKETIDCNKQCIDGCNDFTFSPNLFSSPISYGNFTLKDPLIQNMSNDYIRDNIAVIHFYYLEEAFRSNIKDEYIGLTEFLSSSGGLISLFLGFSFISCMEIIYFLTIRPLNVSRSYQIEKNAANRNRLEVLPHYYNNNLKIDQADTVNYVWRKRVGDKKIMKSFLELNSNSMLPESISYIE